MLEGVVEVNRAQHARIVEKIAAAAGGALDGTVVALWGLTFKAETDDLRDSPSIDVARRLCERGAVVRAFDPAAGEKAGRLVPQLDITADPYEAAQGADVIAVMRRSSAPPPWSKPTR